MINYSDMMSLVSIIVVAVTIITGLTCLYHATKLKIAIVVVGLILIGLDAFSDNYMTHHINRVYTAEKSADTIVFKPKKDTEWLVAETKAYKIISEDTDSYNVSKIISDDNDSYRISKDTYKINKDAVINNK